MLDLKKIYAPILKGNENWNKSEISVYCPFHSHHNNTPSASVNTRTGQFFCFVCSKKGEKSGAVSFYAKLHNITISQALKDLDEFDDDFKERPVQIMPQLAKVAKVVEDIDYSDYCWQTYENSIQHPKNWQFYGQKLYELRGIKWATAVACGVGYDVQKGWIMPTFKYPKGNCVGYEVRKKDFKLFDNGTKCYRSKGGANCLSVTYKGDSERAFVCEGAMDSYFCYQYLHEQAQKKGGEFATVSDTILTPSNGVKILPEVVESLQLWNDFDEIVFILDNDPWLPDKVTGKLKSPGNETKALLATMEHQGKFKFFSGLLEGEDFEDWVKRKQKEGSL